jgi:bifunctional NMN adenylyltransferase/nudix hydrolase
MPIKEKKFNVVVYIGRFQPVHNGHIEVIRSAAKLAHRVIIVVGSADKPRTYKNPFFYQERKALLHGAIKEHRLADQYDTAFTVAPNIDTIYDDTAWMVRIQSIVGANSYPGDKIGIIGHAKDQSSDYLRWFPQWEFIDHALVEPLDATQIRDLYFRESMNPSFIQSVVPTSVLHFMNGFAGGHDFTQIIKERSFLNAHARMWAAAPYPPTFQTADVVLIQAGHILMVKRRAEPGKGLWALPGGYLNAKTDATIFDAAIRELIEETGVKVPEKVLRGSVKSSKVFDAIGRSERGRIITQAFFIALSDGEWNLPKVKGSDDAEKAEWIPIYKLNSSEIFEDHMDIIQYFVGQHTTPQV